MARFLVLYDKTMPVKTPADIYVIEAIRKERMAQKVSQAMLAYGIGVSKGFIGMAESPKYDIKYTRSPGSWAVRPAISCPKNRCNPEEVCDGCCQFSIFHFSFLIAVPTDDRP